MKPIIFIFICFFAFISQVQAQTQAQGVPNEQEEFYRLVHKEDPNRTLLLHRGDKVRLGLKDKRRFRGRLTGFSEDAIWVNGDRVPLKLVDYFKASKVRFQGKRNKSILLVGLGMMGLGGIFIGLAASAMTDFGLALLTLFGGISLIYAGIPIALVALFLMGMRKIKLKYHPQYWEFQNKTSGF